MKKHHRFLTAVLSLVFCISVFNFTAYADNEDISQIPDQPVIEDPTQEPPPQDPPIYTDPEPTGDYSSSDVSDNSQYQYSDTDSGNNSYNSQQDDYDSNYYNDNYNNNYNDSSSSFYVGGGQSYVPPESTAPSVSVYDVDDRKIDDSELSSKDWKDIQTNLSKSDASGTDSDDFAFIKNNDSKNDNGEWMLILGITFIILSIAGIVYVIASNVLRRKKATAGGNHRSGAPRNTSAKAHYYSGSDYSDGYKMSAKNDERRRDRSRRFDTAEVRVPKSSNGNHYKDSGRRYR